MPETMNVYVIGEGESGPVKIGIAEHPNRRVRQLQIGNPRPLTLFWHVSRADSSVIESWVQRKLQASNISGEWYAVEVAVAIAGIEQAIALADCGRISNLVRATNIREIGGQLERLCGVCKQWKELSDFSIARNKLHRVASRCKLCCIEWQRVYRLDPSNREKHNAIERARKRRIRDAIATTGENPNIKGA